MRHIRAILKWEVYGQQNTYFDIISINRLTLSANLLMEQKT
jgi:hypothetical protein